MIEFACWGCGKLLKAPDDAGGKKCKCTKCQRENSIPVIVPPMPVETPKEVEYVPPPVQTEPKVVQPTPMPPTPPTEPAQPVQYVYVYRTHPALVVFAAIGMVAVFLFVVYMMPEKNAGIATGPRAVPRDDDKVLIDYNELLDYSDEKADKLLGSLTADSIEKIWWDWQTFQMNRRNPVDLRNALRIGKILHKHYVEKVPEERRQNPLR